jgi:hypothetical protein
MPFPACLNRLLEIFKGDPEVLPVFGRQGLEIQIIDLSRRRIHRVEGALRLSAYD